MKAHDSGSHQPATLDVFVHDEAGGKGAISGAPVRVFNDRFDWKGMTGADGHCLVTLPCAGTYQASTEAHGLAASWKGEVHAGCQVQACCALPFGFAVETFRAGDDCTTTPCNQIPQGQSLLMRLSWRKALGRDFTTALIASGGTVMPGYQERQEGDRQVREYLYHAHAQGLVSWTAQLTGSPELSVHGELSVLPNVQNVAGELQVSRRRTQTTSTPDTAFWQAILNSTEALSFNNYLGYMNWLFCGEAKPADLAPFESERFEHKAEEFAALRSQRLLPFAGADAYRVVKAATEAFVMVNCGVLAEPRPFDAQKDEAYFDRRDLPYPVSAEYLVDVQGNKTLPYLAVIRAKLPDIPLKLNRFEDVRHGRDGQGDNCYGILQEKLGNPCLLELIWSYWQEEGMLVQTVNSITRRFQNIRGPGERDALAHVEIDPLRPLNNLLWGYVQDEQHRLSVVRRNYEYDHHYGLRLDGKAVQEIRAADSRSKFIEAFHNLLRLLPSFYKQDDDTNVKADAFPVLNALKEVHLILSQGAHNQFGDLPSTARIEMLMQQWLLARPELREFLPTRVMVAYPEPWMDRVDAMKKLQGWSDTSVLHFRNLAVFGEQLLLSIRWGHWSDVYEPLQAFNWARFFRPQVQGYVHAYRAATGVDLGADTVDVTLPSLLLRRRLEQQRRNA